MQEVQETWVHSLGQEDPLEKEMATCSSILARIIPWTGSLAGYSPWGCRESDTAEHVHTHYINTHSTCDMIHGLRDRNRRRGKMSIRRTRLRGENGIPGVHGTSFSNMFAV